MVFMMASNPKKYKNDMSSLSSLKSFNKYECVRVYVYIYIHIYI
jgi:hypothetical protein